MKKKDIVVFSIIGLVGIVGIYFIFSMMLGDEENVVREDKPSGAKSNFSKLNTKVTKEEAVVTDSKIELLNEEMRQRQLLEAQREEELRKGEDGRLNKSKMSDIGDYIAKGKVGSDKLTQVEPLDKSNTKEDATEMRNDERKITLKKKSSLQSQSNQNSSPLAGKRKRKEGISFDSNHDDVVISTSSDIAALVHGEQKVSNGSRLTIRITDPLVLEGCTSFEPNSIFTGQVVMLDSRIKVKINIPCDKGGKRELIAFDMTDNEEGLYFDKPDAGDKALTQGIQDISQQTLSRSGIPILSKVGTIVSSTKVQPKANGQTVVLPSGAKFKLKVQDKSIQ